MESMRYVKSRLLIYSANFSISILFAFPIRRREGNPRRAAKPLFLAPFDIVPTLRLFVETYVTTSLVYVTFKYYAKVFTTDKRDLVVLYRLQDASKRQSEDLHYDPLYDMSNVERGDLKGSRKNEYCQSALSSMTGTDFYFKRTEDTPLSVSAPPSMSLSYHHDHR